MVKRAACVLICASLLTAPAARAMIPIAPDTSDAIRTTVLATRDGIATIDAGTARGVKVGMKLVVYRGNLFVSLLRITIAERNISGGLLVESLLAARPGDSVASPHLLQGASDADDKSRLAIARDKVIRNCMSRAKRELAAGNFREALMEVEQALDLDPKNTNALALADQCRQAIELRRRMDILGPSTREPRSPSWAVRYGVDVTIYEVDKLIGKADSPAALDDAENQLVNAQKILDRDRSLLSDEDHRKKQASIAKLLGLIRAKRAKLQGNKTKTQAPRPKRTPGTPGDLHAGGQVMMSLIPRLAASLATRAVPKGPKRIECSMCHGRKHGEQAHPLNVQSARRSTSARRDTNNRFDSTRSTCQRDRSRYTHNYDNGFMERNTI